MKQAKSPRRKNAAASRSKQTTQAAPVGAPAAFPLVGIGASAGGLETFVELLAQVPPNAGMAFVLIQHLDRTHASYLSEALARSIKQPVTEIENGMRIKPDHVYVIPSNADVGVLDGALTLVPRATEGRALHLPIDFFFKTLAAERGNQAIGIVLTGTGSDGAEGLRAIKAAGGVTFAQDPHSAKFSGMPEAAIQTGMVDFVLPVPDLAQALLRARHHGFVRSRRAAVPTNLASDADLEAILLLVRTAVGVDFGEYKATSIRRRLARRMALLRVETVQAYIRLLQEDPAEPEAFVKDVLIHVTSFFRDGAAFEKLKEHVFPEILKQHQDGSTIRLWCAGCSTGEEAYSLVIALLEFLAHENASEVPFQLFGSDVSETAIKTARAGIYPEADTRDVSPERLARFFSRVESGGYRINKDVRERCAFVKHNVARDPPFSKLDLVSCRNLLIYFGQKLQKRALATFQFALNQPGFLLLGRAETLADSAVLFSPVDKENKIFARTAAKGTLSLAPAGRVLAVASPPVGALMRPSPASDIVKRTESLLLDRYTPPGVIVNERMEILHFHGRTGPYLEPTPGQPRYDLLKMARKGLMADLRVAIAQAQAENAAVRRLSARIEDDGSKRPCDLVVVPIAAPPDSREHVFAVLFEEVKGAAVMTQPLMVPDAGPPSASAAHLDAQQAATLEVELQACRDDLRMIIDENHRTNQELIAANEELLSGNEELQSLNEELETAKEELQSTNEELSTLNEELHARNAELNSANSDLVNILGSVEVPIVIVDSERRIRRFTPRARPILNLLASDVGRPIDDIKPSIAIQDLDAKIAQVIETVTIHEEEAQGRDGRWHRLQIRPYATVDKRIDGAVLSIIDIDALKRALGAAEWARDYARATVEAVQTPLVVLDANLRILSANVAFGETYGLPHSGSEGQAFSEVMDGAWKHAALESALRRALDHHEPFQKLQAECAIPAIGKRSVSLSGRSVRMPGGEPMVLLAVEDVTDRRRDTPEPTQAARSASRRRKKSPH